MKQFAFLILWVTATAVQAEMLSGRVVGVHDGDTVTLLDGRNQQHRIRLAKIDAPEIGHGSKRPGQPFGERSRQSLADLVAGKQVTADCSTKDRYGRSVCTIMAGWVDVNLEQVNRGMAWAYRKYTSDPGYIAAEASARAAGRGLWSDKKAPAPPWEWRLN